MVLFLEYGCCLKKSPRLYIKRRRQNLRGTTFVDFQKARSFGTTMPTSCNGEAPSFLLFIEKGQISVSSSGESLTAGRHRFAPNNDSLKTSYAVLFPIIAFRIFIVVWIIIYYFLNFVNNFFESFLSF